MVGDKRAALILVLVLCLVVVSLPQIRVVKAQGTIYIRADGTVEGTDKIRRDGDIYTFLGSISLYDSEIYGIVVERDNIIVDGSGYTLEGAGGKGIVLSDRNNVTIKNIEVLGCEYGILLAGSSNNRITGNTIKNNTRAIDLANSSGNHISDNYIIENTAAITIGYEVPAGNNIISGNTIQNNTNGISSSGNNVISENLVTGNNHVGIGCHGNSTTLIGNNVTKNGMGIIITGTNNVLRNNSISDNGGSIIIGGKYVTEGGNFWILGDNFVNDVDASNTFDGKPIIYWVNEKNKIVPSNAGYVALVNCTGITVKGLDIAYNGEGIVLAYTNNSRIIGNTIRFKRNGITLWGSSNNYIVGNNITNNVNGLFLSGWIGLSNGSHIPSPNNFIYHNNFIDNKKAVYDIFYDFMWPEDKNSPVNIWDNGQISGGNYWSDYKGEDVYGNGVGATPYYIWRLNIPFPPSVAPDSIDERNKDRYPLLVPINSFDAGTWGWNSYNVNIISNSTVSDFFFNPAEGAFIRFNVTGAEGTTGYCRVTIPKGLLSSEDEWNVVVNGEPVTPIIDEDTESINFYFTYSHSTKTMEIRGTTVIPEFPSWTPLWILLVTVMAVAVVYKRKIQKQGRLKQ
jgi:parallel beta-helix repeat protein